MLNLPCIGVCKPGWFRCNYGLVSDASNAKNEHDRVCIPNYYRCDGEHDCVDGSDEAYKEPKDCMRGINPSDPKCQLLPYEQKIFCGMFNSCCKILNIYILQNNNTKQFHSINLTHANINFCSSR